MVWLISNILQFGFTGSKCGPFLFTYSTTSSTVLNYFFGIKVHFLPNGSCCSFFLFIFSWEVSWLCSASDSSLLSSSSNFWTLLTVHRFVCIFSTHTHACTATHPHTHTQLTYRTLIPRESTTTQPCTIKDFRVRPVSTVE